MEATGITQKMLRLKFLHNSLSDTIGINKNTYLKGSYYVMGRRDNPKKIRLYQSRIDVYKYSIFPNTIDNCNALPSDVVTANKFQTAIEDCYLACIAIHPSLCCLIHVVLL